MESTESTCAGEICPITQESILPTQGVRMSDNKCYNKVTLIDYIYII